MPLSIAIDDSISLKTNGTHLGQLRQRKMEREWTDPARIPWGHSLTRKYAKFYTERQTDRQVGRPTPLIGF